MQSFVGLSDVRNLEEALGQYLLYRLVLARQQPDRPLYFGVPLHVADGILSEPIGEMAVAGFGLKVLVFHPDRREVVRWIS